MEEKEGTVEVVNPDLSANVKEKLTGATVFVTNPGSVQVEFGNEVVFLSMTVGRPPQEKEINILKKVKH